jgi:hypothetical protein
MTDSQHSRDDGGAKLKRQETTDDILDVALKRDRKARRSEADRAESSTRTQNAKFASIESNPFYAIVFGEGDPEAKKSAIAKQLAYDVALDKSENKAFSLRCCSITQLLNKILAVIKIA